MTDITELAQSLKAEDISSERMEWLKKLADMEYCASNPGHWLMNLKETNYLASLALQCLESNSTLAEALEKVQQRIDSQREYYDGVIADGGKRIAELESRTVKLPPKVDSSNIPFAGHTWNCCLDEVEKRLAAAGIKVEAE